MDGTRAHSNGPAREKERKHDNSLLYLLANLLLFAQRWFASIESSSNRGLIIEHVGNLILYYLSHCIDYCCCPSLQIVRTRARGLDRADKRLVYYCSYSKRVLRTIDFLAVDFACLI